MASAMSNDTFVRANMDTGGWLEGKSKHRMTF